MSISEDLEALRLPHLVIEDDCWFSCPASGQCCNDDAVAAGTCNCGAEAHNAKLDAILAQLSALKPTNVVGGNLDLQETEP
jgi:hypothetical protein